MVGSSRRVVLVEVVGERGTEERRYSMRRFGYGMLGYGYGGNGKRCDVSKRPYHALGIMSRISVDVKGGSCCSVFNGCCTAYWLAATEAVFFKHDCKHGSLRSEDHEGQILYIALQVQLHCQFPPPPVVVVHPVGVHEVSVATVKSFTGRSTWSCVYLSNSWSFIGVAGACTIAKINHGEIRKEAEAFQGRAEGGGGGQVSVAVTRRRLPAEIEG